MLRFLTVTVLGVGGTIAGRYRLERIIAEGGAGTVLEAHDDVTGQPVAVKVPLAKYRQHAEVCARLEREGQALARVRHPFVVELLDSGQSEEYGPFLVLELLRGKTLHGTLAARGRLGVHEALRVGVDLAAALEASHGHGVIHRDVKPGNVLLASDEQDHGRLKLIDFGVASLPGAVEHSGDRRLTGEGGVLGTAEYMAPEQLLGDDDLDERVDIYALGATLWECLTGNVPFEGNHAAVLVQVSTQRLPPLANLRPDLPRPLTEAIDRALARERVERWSTARELGAALLAAGRQLDPALPPSPLELPRPRRAAPTPATAASPRSLVLDRQVSGEQRRRHARAPYVTPVTIRRPGGATLFGRSEDISEGGVRVLTERAGEPNEQVRVRFALPLSYAFVEATAVARWLRQGRGLGVAGYEFVELPAEAAAEIRRYVDARG